MKDLEIQIFVNLKSLYFGKREAYINLKKKNPADIRNKHTPTKEWQGIFKVMKNKNLQPKLLYPAKLSLRIKGQMKSSPDKKKPKDCIITKPVLYEMLKGLI